MSTATLVALAELFERSESPNARTGDRVACMPMIETPSFAGFMRRCAFAWGRRVAAGDAEDLAQLVAYRDELDDIIRGAIVAARVTNHPHDSAWSWQRIADVLGLKAKSSAFERYSAPSWWRPDRKPADSPFAPS